MSSLKQVYFQSFFTSLFAFSFFCVAYLYMQAVNESDKIRGTVSTHLKFTDEMLENLSNDKDMWVSYGARKSIKKEND